MSVWDCLIIVILHHSVGAIGVYVHLPLCLLPLFVFSFLHSRAWNCQVCLDSSTLWVTIFSWSFSFWAILHFSWHRSENIAFALHFFPLQPSSKGTENFSYFTLPHANAWEIILFSPHLRHPVDFPAKLPVVYLAAVMFWNPACVLGLHSWWIMNGIAKCGPFCLKFIRVKTRDTLQFQNLWIPLKLHRTPDRMRDCSGTWRLFSSLILFDKFLMKDIHWKPFRSASSA